MRYLLMVITVLQTFLASNAQHLEKGYYVTLAGDTVQTTLKVRKDLFGSMRIETLQRKVKTADSLNQELTTLDQDDIKAYAFSYKDKVFIFSLKQLTGKRSRFFQQLAAGTTAACYYYFQTGTRGAVHQTFIMERSATSRVLLKGGMTKNTIRRKLAELFQDRDDIKTFIMQAPLSKRRLDKSLTELTDAINRL